MRFPLIPTAGLFFCIIGVAWAGRAFPEKSGEEVVTREYLVKLKPGVQPATVLPGFMPGAGIKAARIPNVYVVTAAPGTASGASGALAAHGLVEFVEPNRIR